MNDFNTLKNIFEMAEYLDYEGEDTLEIITVDEKTDKTAVVTFHFNEEGELSGVYVQE